MKCCECGLPIKLCNVSALLRAAEKLIKRNEKLRAIEFIEGALNEYQEWKHDHHAD
jgi:hypothetical protein